MTARKQWPSQHIATYPVRFQKMVQQESWHQPAPIVTRLRREGEHSNTRSVHPRIGPFRSRTVRDKAPLNNELRTSTLKKDRGRKPRFGRERPRCLCGFAAQTCSPGRSRPNCFIRAPVLRPRFGREKTKPRKFLKSGAYFFFDRFSRLLAH